MAAYLKWLGEHPDTEDGGHGDGDPSGDEADKEGKNYK